MDDPDVTVKIQYLLQQGMQDKTWITIREYKILISDLYVALSDLKFLRNTYSGSFEYRLLEVTTVTRILE